jgi:site-specific DNA-adenine methylase
MKRPTYTGGKGGNGVLQFLTNFLKPCHRYVSLFAGLDAVLWHLQKKPNEIWINDIDNSVLSQWKKYFDSQKKLKSNTILTCQDYQDVLSQLQEPYYQAENNRGLRTTIFIDPPYLMETRNTQQNYYKREMSTSEQHKELIETILAFERSSLGFDIMITHYPCELYREFEMAGWTITEFTGRTRQGTRPEWLITNYKQPQELQDYSHIGKDVRERLDIKRKIKRWEQKFKTFTPQIQNAILDRII